MVARLSKDYRRELRHAAERTASSDPTDDCNIILSLLDRIDELEGTVGSEPINEASAKGADSGTVSSTRYAGLENLVEGYALIIMRNSSPIVVPASCIEIRLTEESGMARLLDLVSDQSVLKAIRAEP